MIAISMADEPEIRRTPKAAIAASFLGVVFILWIGGGYGFVLGVCGIYSEFASAVVILAPMLLMWFYVAAVLVKKHLMPKGP